MKTSIGIFNFILALLLVTVLAILFICHRPANSLPEGHQIHLLTSEQLNDDDPYYIGDAFIMTLRSTVDSYTEYSLGLILPENEHDISIMLPSSFSYYQFKINGESLRVNNDYTTSSILPSPDIINYHANDRYISITLYLPKNDQSVISPYFNLLINTEFRIGTPDTIAQYSLFLKIVSFILIVFFLTTMFFSILSFFNRHRDMAHIGLVFLSLSSIITLLISGRFNNLLQQFNISLFLAVKLTIFSYALRIYGFIILISTLFNQKQSTGALRTTSIMNGFLLLVFLFLPIESFPFIVPAYFIFSFLCILSAFVYGVILFHKTKNEYFCYYTCGFLILLLAVFSEFMYSINWTTLTPLYNVTLLVYIVILTNILMKRYNASLRNNKKLTLLLKEKVFELQTNKSTYISAHIKPDYLYETLDAIESYIGVNQAKVDSLIQSLATYLRQTLDFSDDNFYHTINEEIKYCRAFITLTKEFHPEITFIINIDNNLPVARVPKYSIQAILENSIKYAFKTTMHPIVTLSITKYDGYLNVYIIDNGCGMTPSEIEFALDKPTGNLDMGLYHINQLLKDELNSSLHIESVLNKSTKVEFNIDYSEVETDESEIS